MAIARKNSFVLPKAWAEDGSTVIPNPPVAGTTYRDETVDEANIAEGQTYDGVADSARWNQLLYMMTSIMQDCLAHGILPWINTQDYLEGAVVMGSNGNLYKALAASKSVDPTTDDTGKWELAGTINPAKVAAPMSYSSDEGLKLNLGNSMQVASNKLDAKLKANSGLRIGTDGIYAHLNSNFLRPDANDNGRLGGSVQEFSGNIDLLTSINTTAFYVLKSSSTGTKPEGMNTFWLACIGGAQIAIYGSDMAVRSYDQSAQTWNEWKTISKMGSQYLPLTGGHMARNSLIIWPAGAKDPLEPGAEYYQIYEVLTNGASGEFGLTTVKQGIGGAGGLAIVYGAEQTSPEARGAALVSRATDGGGAAHSLVAKSNAAYADGKIICRSVNGVNANVGGDITLNVSTAAVLQGSEARWNSNLTLPGYGTWKWIGTTNYRSNIWEGSSDGASAAGVSGGGAVVGQNSQAGSLAIRTA